MAKDLQDTSLLAKIEGADLIALEAKYHFRCSATLRNRHRSHTKENNNAFSECVEEEKKEARAFVELIAYIENSVEVGIFFEAIRFEISI